MAEEGCPDATSGASGGARSGAGKSQGEGKSNGTLQEPGDVHRLSIGGETFEVPCEAGELVFVGAEYRLYVAPRTRRCLAIELAWRPSSATIASASPRDGGSSS